jgi:hypothetical protein
VQQFLGDATTEKFSDFFTLDGYRKAFVLLPLSVLFSIVILSLLLIKRKSVLRGLALLTGKMNSIMAESKRCLKKLNKAEIVTLLFVIACIVLSRAYLFNMLPFNHDEAFSYFSFVRKSPELIMTFYSDVNNHVFNNLLTYPFTFLFEDPLWVMRVPVLLTSFLIFVLVFFFCLRHYNFQTALLGLILTGFPFSTSFYSVIGRGYILLSFFTLLAFFSFIKLTEQRNSLFYFVLLIASSILGAYTIPLFVLPFLAVSSYGLFISLKEKDYAFAKKIILGGVIVGAGVLYLYAPLIIVSGFDTLVSNKFIMTYDDFSWFFKNILVVASVEGLNFILGFYSKGYLILPFIFLMIYFVYKKTPYGSIRKFYILGLFFLFVSYAFFLGRKTIMEVRMFTFFAYVFYFLMALTFNYYLDKIRNIAFQIFFLIGFTVFLFILTPVTFRRKMCDFQGQDYFISYRNVESGINHIVKTNPDSIFINDQHLLWGYQYWAFKNKKDIFFETVFYNPDIDYDFLIVDNFNDLKKIPDTTEYKQVPGLYYGRIFERISR